MTSYFFSPVSGKVQVNASGRGDVVYTGTIGGASGPGFGTVQGLVVPILRGRFDAGATPPSGHTGWYRMRLEFDGAVLTEHTGSIWSDETWIMRYSAWRGAGSPVSNYTMTVRFFDLPPNTDIEILSRGFIVLEIKK